MAEHENQPRHLFNTRGKRAKTGLMFPARWYAALFSILVLGSAQAFAESEGEQPKPDTEDTSVSFDKAPQDSGSDLYDFLAQETVIDLGGGRASAVRESPASVWLIDGRTLRNSAALSLMDIFRQIPNSIVNEINLGQSEASLRAVPPFPENQTLVLLDGRSAMSEQLGTFDRHLLNFEDIERVEIVQGPASTLYGANAFSGVWSIVTKPPPLNGHESKASTYIGIASGKEYDNDGRNLRGAAMGGAFARYGYGWVTGGLKLSVGAAYAPSFGSGGGGSFRVNEPMQRITGGIDLLQNLGEWQLRAQVTAAVKRNSMVILDIGVAEQQNYVLNTHLRREKLWGKDDILDLRFHGQIYRLFHEPFVAGYPTRVDMNQESIASAIEFKYALPTFSGNAITVGSTIRFSANRQTATQSDAASRIYNFGIFLEDTFRPIEPLIFTAGIRLDTREAPFTEPLQYLSVSPRASTVYLVNEVHTLRLEYSSAFRSPTVLENYAELETEAGQPVWLGSPDILNERVHSFSLSYLAQKDWFSSRLELYAANITDLITPDYVLVTDEQTTSGGVPLDIPPDGFLKYPYVYQNEGGGWLPGAMVRFDAQPSEILRAFAYYAFTPGAAPHNVGLGADVEWRRFSGSTQIFYRDASEVLNIQSPARVIWNVKGSYALDKKKHWRASVSGINLTDTRWFPKPRGPGVTRRSSESLLGEHLGPRVWLALEYHLPEAEAATTP